MLITSKYETYCRICGRPIFVDDLFDWDKDNRKRHQCIVCFLEKRQTEACYHWAVTYSSYIYEGSNKYPTGAGHNKELPLSCMFCGKELSNRGIQYFTPAHTTYIANHVTRQYGGDSPTRGTHGHIAVADFSKNNPDYEALHTLKRIFIDPDFSSYQGAIAKHAERIAQTYPTMNLDISRFQTISFDECLKKHFPLTAQSLEIQCDLLNAFGMGEPKTLERMTLSLLADYDGRYELADGLLGALIMHVKLGNISCFDLSDLLCELNWNDQFREDLIHLSK